ncbi:MAG TPA: 5'-nucleotidase C-terminal domain-containing protein [Nocardioides sp.]|nr:5'-nucleotidase C-terminal domain-containing protein [Nocardioides sp.]
MSIHSRRGLAVVTVGLALVAAPLALTSGAVGAETTTTKVAAAKKKTPRYTKLDLYAINDFHGQLEKGSVDDRPGRTGSGEVNVNGVDVAAGGAEYLATHLHQLRRASRDRGAKPLTVAAGDLIGATPLLSAAFHDEPTIEAMNAMRLKVSAVGNHEFDEGFRELRRLQRGTCLADGPDGADNQNSCPDPDRPFEGADFQYLAANVKKESTGRTILPAYTVKRVGDHRVAFIGMTLKDTPNIVTAEGVRGLRFTDEVRTVNKLVPRIRERGIKAIVVLLHQGLSPSPITDPSGCEGEIADDPGYLIGTQLDPAVDLVVQGHTHQPYLCTVRDPNGRKRLLTSAYANGRVVTEIRLKLKRGGDVLRRDVRAFNRVVTNADGTRPSSVITELIERYSALVAPIANRVLGQIAPAATRDTLSKSADPDGRDSELGNLIADSQRTDPSTIPGSGARAGVAPQVALMNPGGIRQDLVENADNDVTYGAAFNVQPFNNYVVSQDLTGAQLLAVLNEQWNGRNENTDPTKYNVLQVSGLSYTWDVSDAAAVGGNALVGDVLVDADRDPATPMVPVDPAATYRVAVNSFLAGGGDGFPTLADGTNVHFGGLDIDSLARFLEAHDPYQPEPTTRISSQP